MAGVWKDILWPCRLVVPNRKKGAPEGSTHELIFTPGDMADIAATGNRMVREGRHIPAMWEHQNAVSLSRSDAAAFRAKHLFGWLRKFRVGPNNELQTYIDDIDPDDRARLRKVRFCSPRLLWDWKDETGKVWPRYTVQHLAATPIPVQSVQGSFDLSRAGHRSVGVTVHRPRLIDLSRALSVELSMADEYDDTDDTAAGDDTGTATTTDAGKYAEAVSALEKCGIHLGADALAITDPEDFIARIVAACHTKAGMTGDDEYPEEDEIPSDDDVTADATASPPPVTMSRAAERQTRINLIAQVRRNKLANRGQKKHLEERAKVINLSWDDKGDLKANEVTEALRLLSLGTARPAADLSRAVEPVQPPEHLSAHGEAARAERIKKLAREAAERNSRPGAKS